MRVLHDTFAPLYNFFYIVFTAEIAEVTPEHNNNRLKLMNLLQFGNTKPRGFILLVRVASNRNPSSILLLLHIHPNLVPTSYECCTNSKHDTVPNIVSYSYFGTPTLYYFDPLFILIILYAISCAFQTLCSIFRNAKIKPSVFRHTHLHKKQLLQILEAQNTIQQTYLQVCTTIYTIQVVRLYIPVRMTKFLAITVCE